MFIRKVLPVAMILMVFSPIVVGAGYDSDGDGIADDIDVCCGTPTGTSVDALGRPIGDVDLDCDVDLNDVARLAANFTGPLYPCRPCTFSLQCMGDAYCAKRQGDCESEGFCSPSPESCSDVLEPVCACDGQTYDNSCFAALAGESVHYAGECQTGCQSNAVCEATEYCAKDVGDCDGTGECLQRPGGCIPSGAPSVCGCDGVNYDEACYAAFAGASIDHEGSCP